MVAFSCDASSASKPFPHFWEHTVGSCHATLALRADWQQQLHRAHRELGFKHVRFHGLLCDDVGTLVDENDTYVYSFFNADQICDFLLSIGMKPFVELSFMPSILAAGSDIVFHYKGIVDPPRDYNAWQTLTSKLVAHWVERYGIDEVLQWFFEVWNEPNLDAFWKGSQADYFNLYRHTADAIKQVHPSLKVGGPATADNEWITEFKTFCSQNNVPVDFISTHHYPTDSFGKPGDDTVAQLAQSRRSVLREEAQAVKEKAGNLPVYYTEWSSSSNPFDEMHDNSYSAAFVMKTVIEASGLVEGYSYWTFSDIFEENYFSSIPFHGGFGLQNIYGIRKPAYYTFQLLHHLGEELLQVSGNHATVDVWVIRKQKNINIIITNWALPRHPIQTETVEIRLEKLAAVKRSYVERIDEDHANARAQWQAMGSPGSLTPKMVHEIESRSRMVPEPFGIGCDQTTTVINIEVKPQSVTCITLEVQ